MVVGADDEYVQLVLAAHGGVHGGAGLRVAGWAAKCRWGTGRLGSRHSVAIWAIGCAYLVTSPFWTCAVLFSRCRYARTRPSPWRTSTWFSVSGSAGLMGGLDSDTVRTSP